MGSEIRPGRNIACGPTSVGGVKPDGEGSVDPKAELIQSSVDPKSSWSKAQLTIARFTTVALLWINFARGTSFAGLRSRVFLKSRMMG